jgi:DNA-binding response OmpR family regulator
LAEIEVAASRLQDQPPPPEAASAPASRLVAQRLPGRRILVVEDEPLLAMELEAALAEIGCAAIGPAGSLAEATRLLAAEPHLPDAAVLDVNLGGTDVFPLVRQLRTQGVPILFATGYGELPPEEADMPLLRKPLARGELQAALIALLAAQVPGAKAGRETAPAP